MMAVDQISFESNCEVTDGVKSDREIDVEYCACLVAVEIETNHVPPEGELPSESKVKNWVTDSECSRFMTPLTDDMVSYLASRGIVRRVADHRVRPMKGVRIGHFNLLS